MSHRSASSQLPVTGMATAIPGMTDCARSPGSRPSRAPPVDRSGWTLGHAGRQVRVGPVAFWIIVGSLVVMAGWSAMTATYFAFRDDVLTRLLARQAQMQFAYEDRIADLRGQVDRLASRQLLDQEQFETKLDQITRRQALLESRSSALSSLPDTAPTGSIKPAAARRRTRDHRAAVGTEALADQRHRHPGAAARARGAARIPHAVQFGHSSCRAADPGRHRGRARAAAGLARPLRGRSGQDA